MDYLAARNFQSTEIDIYILRALITYHVQRVIFGVIGVCMDHRVSDAVLICK